MTIGQLQYSIYEYYLDVYKNARDNDKKNGTNVLQSTNKYTFASDMVVCLMFEDVSIQIDKYINSMLRKRCRGNKQGYFEMILSTMVMGQILAELGKDEESKLCIHWHAKLLYEVYDKYVTDEEISNIWRLR